ncbi:MAG: hypothetical protein HEQ39_08430 [Rhizobacter sp.]
MTSHIRPGSMGSTEHDVGGGLSRQRSMRHGHLAHPAQPRVVQVPVGVGSSNYPDETANETQRLLRRLPTAVRVISIGAAAMAQGPDHDNNELQRLQNRYPSDVSHLMSIFKETVARMDAAGERSPGSGELNGWKNNWLGGTGFQPKYLKCADQASEVMAALLMRAQTRAKWTYTYEQRIPGPVPLHIWVKAQSDNPSDPVLHLDAWNNEVRIEPAGPKTSPTKK